MRDIDLEIGLKSHIAVCHDGAAIADCAACCEILAQIEKRDEQAKRDPAGNVQTIANLREQLWALGLAQVERDAYRDALLNLLASDGHEGGCAAVRSAHCGCKYGEAYKVARGDAWRLLREA